MRLDEDALIAAHIAIREIFGLLNIRERVGLFGTFRLQSATGAGVDIFFELHIK